MPTSNWPISELRPSWDNPCQIWAFQQDVFFSWNFYRKIFTDFRDLFFSNIFQLSWTFFLRFWKKSTFLSFSVIYARHNSVRKVSLRRWNSADPEVDVCLISHEIPEGALDRKRLRTTMKSAVMNHVAGALHHQNRVRHFRFWICNLFWFWIVVP